MHGRLRARPGAVVARRHPGRLQRQAPGARHGALPVDHGRRGPARPGDGRRGRQPGHQRPRGLHARTTSSSSASRRSAGSSWPPGSRPTASRARAGSAARWRRGSSMASPSSTSGRWTSAGSGRPIEARATRWRARSRTTRPTTTSTTRTRSARPGGRCGWRRRIRSSRGWARPSARSPAGSARTGSSRTPPPATKALRPRGWAGEHWSPAIGAEALATRQAAGLFDETSFAKIEIVGPGAVAFLQSMCANDVDVPVGRIIYTQLLNRRGGIECDVTVTRVTADRYLFITGTAFGQHDLAWLRRHLPGDGSVLLNDLTSGRVCFALWGPRARDILAAVTRDDVSDAGFPYLTARAITVGSVPVYALRVTYVGELGWELYAHTEFGVALWRTLWEAGRPPRAGRRRLPGDRRAPASRRATASGRATSRRTRRRTRRGSGSRSRSTRGPISSAATRSSRPRRPGRGSGCAASSWTIRGRSASATSPCGSMARSSAG